MDIYTTFFYERKGKMRMGMHIMSGIKMNEYVMEVKM
jgi:hypothetical protein